MGRVQRTYRLRCDDKETMTEWLDVLKKTAEQAQKSKGDGAPRKKSKQTDGSKHPWTKQEDDLLKKLIDKHGAKDWSDLAKGVSVCARASAGSCAPPPVDTFNGVCSAIRR